MRHGSRESSVLLGHPVCFEWINSLYFQSIIGSLAGCWAGQLRENGIWGKGLILDCGILFFPRREGRPNVESRRYSCWQVGATIAAG